MEALINQRKAQLIEQTKKPTYGYCIYLDNKLYSRFKSRYDRQRHLNTIFFQTASYQKSIRLLYFKEPPSYLAPISQDAIKNLSLHRLRQDATEIQDQSG